MQLALDLPLDDRMVTGPAHIGPAQVTYRLARQILAPATGMVQGYDFTLNPYSGCTFGCAYCYAANFTADPGRAAAWGQWVEVKANALELLRRETRIRGARLYVGSVTDPYQPIERQVRLTRSLLGHLARLGVPPRIVLQTRSPYVVDDIDLFRRFPHLRVNISITTDDDDIRREFEPGCAAIWQRLHAARALIEAGIKVGICVSPMLPIKDPERFASELRHLGAARYTTSYFHRDRGAFASGTRAAGRDLAAQYRWDAGAFLETMIRMKKVLPELESKGRGFQPE